LSLFSYTSKHFFCTSNIFLNFQKTLWPFKKIHGHHTPKITSRCWFSEVKIYHQKSTSGSQNISLEINFQKSKYITGSRLPKIKIYHRKSTSGSQNVSSEVDFQKSKCITGSRLSEVKKHYRKSTSRNQKINSILNIFNSF